MHLICLFFTAKTLCNFTITLWSLIFGEFGTAPAAASTEKFCEVYLFIIICCNFFCWILQIQISYREWTSSMSFQAKTLAEWFKKPRANPLAHALLFTWLDTIWPFTTKKHEESNSILVTFNLTACFCL